METIEGQLMNVFDEEFPQSYTTILETPVTLTHIFFGVLGIAVVVVYLLTITRPYRGRLVSGIVVVASLIVIFSSWLFLISPTNTPSGIQCYNFSPPESMTITSVDGAALRGSTLDCYNAGWALTIWYVIGNLVVAAIAITLPLVLRARQKKSLTQESPSLSVSA